MKKKKTLLILGIILTILLFISFSYAYYIKSYSQENSNIVKTKCLNLSITNEKNDIKLDEQYPIPDSEGKKLTPYQFTIINTCEQFISYNVNLEALEGTTMDSNAIKVMVNNEAPVNLATLDVIQISIKNSVESRTLVTGSLGSGDSVDYAIRLWMDYGDSADLSSMNKVFNSKVVVTATIGTYKPSDYVSTLHDAILVNEYGVTDVDNAIKRIESKDKPDFNQTAPIIVWKQNNIDNSKITIRKISPNIIGNSDYKAEKLKESDSKILLGTSYSFNSAKGVYNLENTGYYDESSINYGDDNYYFCDGGVHFSADGVPSTYDGITNCTNIYKINNLSSYLSANDNVEDYFKMYTIQGVNLNRLEEELDRSEKGIYVENDDYGKTYYYRGSILNNNVYFGGYYWQIIRINGNGTIRLLYNGKTTKNSDNSIENSAFNELYDNPAYAGYMYGNDLNTRDNLIKNENSSTIKLKLDEWFKLNIIDKGLEKYIGDGGFCNDRSIVSGDGVSTSETTGFSANYRVSSNAPTFTCKNINEDLFTTSNAIIGNKALIYSIGLITTDELIFAGMSNGISNVHFYAYSANHYWTMSPAIYSPYHNSLLHFFPRSSSGRIDYDRVNYNFSVRPVINLKADVEISGGIGTINDPYTIKEKS